MTVGKQKHMTTDASSAGLSQAPSRNFQMRRRWKNNKERSRAIRMRRRPKI